MEIPKELEALAEEARLISVWGKAKDFAHQVMEKQRLLDETTRKHVNSFAHFGYGLGPNPWHCGIDFTNKQQLIDFYNKVVHKGRR